MVIRRIFFFFSNSFFILCGIFFLFSILLRINVGIYHSGWIAIILFLVFIGGILIILFYLGMFGNYFNIKFIGNILFFFLLLVIPPVFYIKKKINSTGDSSLNFYKIIFLGGVSILLFFLLNGIRKILGIGSAMRRFF